MTTSPPPSKAKKILRRTLVGGSLVCVVAALLWWVSASGRSRPLLYVTGILTLDGTWVASRMGSLAFYDVFPSLALAALAVLVLVDAGLESAAVVAEARPGAPAGTYFFQAKPSLLYGFAVLTGLA